MLPLSSFNHTGRMFSLSAVHTFKDLHLNINGEWEIDKDNLTYDKTNLQGYSLAASYSPTLKQTYRGYIQHRQHLESGLTAKSSVTGGVGGSINFTEKTSLNFDATTTTHRTTVTTTQDVFDLRLEHRFENRQSISLRGRYTPARESNQEKELALIMEYSIPFGYPVSRKTSAGSVKGYIYDAETGIRYDRVVVRLNGVMAVTDKRGEFIFPALPPATYYVQMERSRIGLEKTTTQQTPGSVSVKGGQETFLVIGVTRSAELRGQVIVHPLADNEKFFMQGQREGQKPIDNGEKGEEQVSYGLPNMIVELSSVRERHRRVTDAEGRFTFADLSPGPWTLKLFQENLPPYYRFERETYQLEMAPGKREVLTVKVLPVRRPIQIIEEGGTLIEE